MTSDGFYPDGFHPKGFFTGAMGEEEYIEFCKWAFGLDYMDTEDYTWKNVKSWNDLHGDNPLRGEGNPRQDCQMILRLWHAHKASLT